jgi:hypothetical protein
VCVCVCYNLCYDNTVRDLGPYEIIL